MHSLDRMILLWKQVANPKPADFLQKIASQRRATIGMVFPLGGEEKFINWEDEF